jgi:hypothetical protein
VKNLLGSSATPSRDSSPPATIFRTPYTSDWSRCYELTDQAAETHRCDVQETPEPLIFRLSRLARQWSRPVTGAGESLLRRVVQHPEGRTAIQVRSCIDGSQLE